jgi:GNAT superfamily N-acetyltransferase
VATTQQPSYVTTADGRRITYERWKYEQTVAQEAAMRQVNDLITAEAAAAANVGAGFDQSEFGALLRSIVPQLLDQYGRVNATAALQFYDAQRTQWAETYGPAASQMAGRGNVRAQGSRYAVATTQSALAVSQGYAAQYADDYRRAAKADSVINYAMRVRQSSGHAPSVTAMNNALTREVAMYHRDTVLFNAGLDPFVNRVQRVAQAKACEFCRLMALGSTNGTVRTSTYAVKFHSHCHCTIQPLFDGDQPVRPDYYDEFEKQYADASKSGGSSQDILANWRKLSKADSGLPSLESIYNMSAGERRKAFANIFDRQSFAGLNIKPLSTEVSDGKLHLSGTIFDANGTEAGFVERIFNLSANSVEHSVLRLGIDYRGQGFGTQFSQWSEAWYRQNGINTIRLTTGLRDGGYVWAKAGYQWAGKPTELIAELANRVDGLAKRADTAAKMAAAEHANALLLRMLTTDINDPSYPTPFELANIDGPDIAGLPFGRWLMQHTSWHGKKTL